MYINAFQNNMGGGGGSYKHYEIYMNISLLLNVRKKFKNMKIFEES